MYIFDTETVLCNFEMTLNLLISTTVYIGPSKFTLILQMFPA